MKSRSESELRENNINQQALNGSEENFQICKQCKCSFKDFHAIISHTCQPYKCKICREPFSHDFQLKLHKCCAEEIDNKDNKFKCDFCGVSFETLTIQTRHSLCCYKKKHFEGIPLHERKVNDAVKVLDSDISISTAINSQPTDNTISSNYSKRPIHFSGQFRHFKKLLAIDFHNANGNVIESEDSNSGSKFADSMRQKTRKTASKEGEVSNGDALESEDSNARSKVANSMRQKRKKTVPKEREVSNGDAVESEDSNLHSKVSNSMRQKTKTNSEEGVVSNGDVIESEDSDFSSKVASSMRQKRKKTVSEEGVVSNGNVLESEDSNPCSKVANSIRQKNKKNNSKEVEVLNGDVIESEDSNSSSKVLNSVRQKTKKTVSKEGIVSNIDVLESEDSNPHSKGANSIRQKNKKNNFKEGEVSNNGVLESEESNPSSKVANSVRQKTKKTVSIEGVILNCDILESEDSNPKVSNSMQQKTKTNSEEGVVSNGDIIESEDSNSSSKVANSMRQKRKKTVSEKLVSNVLESEDSNPSSKVAYSIRQKRKKNNSKEGEVSNDDVIESEDTNSSSKVANSMRQKRKKTVSEKLVSNEDVLESEDSNPSSKVANSIRQKRKKTVSDEEVVSNGDLHESEDSNPSSKVAYSIRQKNKKNNSKEGEVSNCDTLESEDSNLSSKVSNSVRQKNKKINSNEGELSKSETRKRSSNRICNGDMIGATNTKKVNNAVDRKTSKRHSTENEKTTSCIDKRLSGRLVHKTSKKNLMIVVQNLHSKHNNSGRLNHVLNNCSTEPVNIPEKRKTVNNVAGYYSKRRKIQERNKKADLQSSHENQKSKVDDTSFNRLPLPVMNAQQKQRSVNSSKKHCVQSDISDSNSSSSSASLQSHQSSSGRLKKTICDPPSIISKVRTNISDSESPLSSPLLQGHRSSLERLSKRVSFSPNLKRSVKSKTTIPKEKHCTKNKKLPFSETVVKRTSVASELKKVKKNSTEFKAPKSLKSQRNKSSACNKKIKDLEVMPNFCRELEISRSTLNAVPDDFDSEVFSSNSMQSGHEPKRKNSSNSDKNTVTLETMLNALPDENSGLLIRILSGTRESFKCPKCSKLFPTLKVGVSHSCKSTRINKNMLISLNDIELMCTYCRYHCNRLSDLNMHKKSCRPIADSNTSLHDVIFNYDNAIKNYRCPTCSFSCLSHAAFTEHSCKQKLGIMQKCVVTVEKVDVESLQKVYKISKFECSVCRAIFFDDTTFNKHLMCHVKDSNKVAKTYIDSGKLFVRSKIKDIIKNSKTCTSVEDILTNLVDPVSNVIAAVDPEKLLPDMQLDVTIPYEHQKLLEDAAKEILAEETKGSKKSTETNVENDDTNLDPKTKQQLDMLRNFECRCKDKVQKPSVEKKPCAECLNELMRTLLSSDAAHTSEMQDEETTSSVNSFPLANNTPFNAFLFSRVDTIQEVLALSSIVNDSSLSSVDPLASFPLSFSNFPSATAAPGACDLGVPGPSGLQISSVTGPTATNIFAPNASSGMVPTEPPLFSSVASSISSDVLGSRTVLEENSQQVTCNFDSAGCSSSEPQQSSSWTVHAQMPSGFDENGRVYYLSRCSDSVQTERIPCVKVLLKQSDVDTQSELYRKSVANLAARLQQLIVISTQNSAELIPNSQSYFRCLSNFDQVIATIVNFEYCIGVEFQLSSVNISITMDYNDCVTCSAYISSDKCVCALCVSEFPPSNLIEHLINEHQETKIVVFVS